MNPIIKSKYKWYKNPIKYFRDRKKIKLMNIIFLEWYNKEGRKEIDKCKLDLLLYGTAIMSNGKRVSYHEFYENKSK